MTAPALALVITTAGLERFTAAQLDDDVDLTISSVGFTNGEFIASPTLTALPGEFRRVNTISGAAQGDNIVHLIVRDEAAVTYSVRGFGLFLGDGTLFAVYGQSGIIVEKSLLSTTLIAIDIAFPTTDINALSFGNTDFLNPPATTATKGVVELATLAEAVTGTDTQRAVTPAGMRAALASMLGIGVVTMWYGSAEAVPAGWAICNGQAVARSDGTGDIITPDLRDRVVVGAGGAHLVGATFGASEKTVNTEGAGAHTPAGELPPHEHPFTRDGDAVGHLSGVTITPTPRGDVAGGGSGSALSAVLLNDVEHSHTVSVSGTTDEVGPLALSMEDVPDHQHEVTVDVTQPSLALHYIMRV